MIYLKKKKKELNNYFNNVMSLLAWVKMTTQNIKSLVSCELSLQ